MCIEYERWASVYIYGYCCILRLNESNRNQYRKRRMGAWTEHHHYHYGIVAHMCEQAAILIFAMRLLAKEMRSEACEIAYTLLSLLLLSFVWS